MNALLVLIPVALILGGLGLAAFLWAMKNGQFDDLDGAAARILDDEEIGNGGEADTAGAPDTGNSDTRRRFEPAKNQPGSAKKA